MHRSRFTPGLLALAATICMGATFLAEDRTTTRRIEPVVKTMHGFKVHVDPALLEGKGKGQGQRALSMLANHLERIAILVPPKKLRRMRTLEIWIEQQHPSLKNMQYHPSVHWLRQHKHDERLAKKVHIPVARHLLSKQQLLKHPAVVLHELAHAYHHQILGFDEPRIFDAFKAAKKRGNYEKVLAHTGKHVRHYALSNHKEYFAEGTEAYLYRNDFFPFVRAELQNHDAQLHTLLQEIWGAK